MSTLEASPLSIHDAEAAPTRGTRLRVVPPLTDTNAPRPRRHGEDKAPEPRIRAVDAAALCMESGCLGG